MNDMDLCRPEESVKNAVAVSDRASVPVPLTDIGGAPRPLPGPGYHAVRFYENERSLAQMVAEFLAEGLTAREPAIVVATPAQRAGILRELVERGVDVVRLERSGELMLLDAEDTLSTFMTDGQPDGGQFNARMSEVIKLAYRTHANSTCRIYGEMVDVLWKQGRQQAAIRLEMLWNQLANTAAFSLLCGYAMGPFFKAANFEEICAHHTHVVSADGHADACDEVRDSRLT
jgi:hypothetical protein